MYVRPVGTGAAGPVAAAPMFSAPTKKTVLRTLDSFTTHIWNGNETTYSTYLATQAHMDVTTFNMAVTHFPAEQFRPTKAFSFQSDSLVLRVSRGVSRLSGVTRSAGCIIQCQCKRCFLLPWYARHGYTTCSQIAIILQPESYVAKWIHALQIS